jgi:transposase-like protein
VLVTITGIWSRWTGILSDGAIRDERDRTKALERENKELRRVNEILKLASALFARRSVTSDEV